MVRPAILTQERIAGLAVDIYAHHHCTLGHRVVVVARDLAQRYRFEAADGLGNSISRYQRRITRG